MGCSESPIQAGRISLWFYAHVFQDALFMMGAALLLGALLCAYFMTRACGPHVAGRPL